MSDQVPSRTDAVVPDPQAADIAPTSGSIATAPGSGLTDAGTIERMAERLRFYESFDELIQANIARSGQLMREAGEKRDEAIATIARSRQQVQTERETQRSALTELLDDVMTIQQATERLAHRVSDALEQIEFELEPIGLHEIGSLAGQQGSRLPAGFSSGTNPFQSVAEAVDDEYRLGVLGQPRAGTATLSTASVPHGVESSSAGRANSTADLSGGAGGAGDAVTESADGRIGNPENDALAADEPAPHDAEEIQGRSVAANDAYEPAPGDGAEAAPIESSAAAWDPAQTAPSTMEDSDLTSVVEPYGEANVASYGEKTEPDGSEETSDAQLASDASDEIPDPGLAAAATDAGDVAADDVSVGTGSTLSFDTEPVSANLTGPDVLGAGEPAGSDHPAGALSESGVDAEVSAVAAENAATVASKGKGHDHDPVPGAHVGSPDEDAVSESGAGPATTDVEPVPVMAPTASASASVEQQTTVVLDGVPRAAIALAIQRHILSKPDVLRAEVREYYDHRLTLFVTGRRATTADDLEDWDGSATWEQIRTSPELLELRMVM